MNLTEAVAQVRQNLRDKGNAQDNRRLIEDSEIESYVLQAVSRYSVDRPRIVAVDAVGDGSVFMAFPADFEQGFSTITIVEKPSTPDGIPLQLDGRAWRVARTPDGDRILWSEGWPASGDAVRVHFTVRHLIDADGSTVPVAHQYSITDLATAFAADAIAAKYASTMDAAIRGDTVNYRSKQQEWDAIAKAYRARYRDALSSGGRPAGGRVNWDSRNSTGLPNLTHPATRR